MTVHRFHFTLIVAFLTIFGPFSAVAFQNPPVTTTEQETNQSTDKKDDQKVDKAHSPEAIAKAYEILDEVASVYRDLENTVEEVTAITSDPYGNGQVQKMTITFGTGTDAKLVIGRRAYTAAGESAYVEYKLVPDKYIKWPLDTDLVVTMKKHGSSRFGLPHFELKRAKSRKEIVSALTSMMQNGRIAGYQTVLDKKTDETLHEILISGPKANLYVRIDPVTYMIRLMRMVMPLGPDAGEMTADIVFKTTQYKELPYPITFVPGDREVVDNPADLVQVPLEKGDTVQDLDLPGLTGEMITVVPFDTDFEVLILWNTASFSGELVMDAAQEMNEWVQESGLPVRVIAVSVLESETGDALKRSVESYWASGEYTYPTLLDADDKAAIAYPMLGLPTILLIDHDKVIRQVFVGTGYNKLESFKKAITRVIQEDESDDSGG